MSRYNLITVAINVVSMVVGAFNLGLAVGQSDSIDWQRRYERERERNDECIVQGPPLCYDHWTSITVPTCDGGTQRLVAEPTFRITCLSSDPEECR